jgi:capsule polysaccharide export protein KpsE/RkpR
MTSATTDKSKTPKNRALARADAHELLQRVRRARARRMGLITLVGVGLPTVLAAIYFLFMASPQFESTALLSASSAQAPGKASDRDSLLVREYIMSRAAMSRLDDEHAFVLHFQNSNADLFARLSTDATREDAYDFYRAQIDVKFDSASGLLTLNVTAFGPEEAARFAGALIAYGEQTLQGLTPGATRIQETQSALPKDTQLGDVQAEAVARQARAARPPGGVNRINHRDGSSASGSAPVGEVTQVGEETVGERAPRHRSAISAAVEHIPASTRPARRLTIIAPPSIAESATKPHRGTGILSVLVLSATLLGIAGLLIAAVREHAKI